MCLSSKVLAPKRHEREAIKMERNCGLHQFNFGCKIISWWEEGVLQGLVITVIIIAAVQPNLVRLRAWCIIAGVSPPSHSHGVDL